MNEGSLPSSPSTDRRSWSQFGTRTVFVLVALAALVAWWARGEMVKEQQREELIAAVESPKNPMDRGGGAHVPWSQQVGAWLRRKPPTGNLAAAWINDLQDTTALLKFVEAFPDTRIDLKLRTWQASPRVLELLSGAKAVNRLHFEGPLDTTDETLSQLAKIRVNQPLTFTVHRVDDDLLQRIAEVDLDIAWIGEAGPRDPFAASPIWSSVTDQGLQTASRLRNLTAVPAGRGGTDQGLAAFQDHPAIDHAELVGPGYTDASAETLATLPMLKSLTLIDTKLSDAGIAKALARGQIHTLVLENAELGEASIAALSSLAKLELRSVPISPELVAALTKQPLNSLTLYGDDYLGQSATIAPNPQGIVLDVPHPMDQRLFWSVRAGQPFLFYFNTTRAGATARIMNASIRPYVHLTLGGPNINAATFAKWHRFDVESVALNGSSIDDEALLHLPQTYRSLWLVRTRVTTKGLRSLKSTGARVGITLNYPENTAPPVPQREIDEINSAGGLTTVSLRPVDQAMFDRWLPRSAQKLSTEAMSP